MYKNLSEMAAHKKGLWSKVVVPKKHFFCRILCLIAGSSFFQSTVFHESSCGHPNLNGYCVYFRRALGAMN